MDVGSLNLQGVFFGPQSPTKWLASAKHCVSNFNLGHKSLKVRQQPEVLMAKCLRQECIRPCLLFSASVSIIGQQSVHKPSSERNRKIASIRKTEIHSTVDHFTYYLHRLKSGSYTYLIMNNLIKMSITYLNQKIMNYLGCTVPKDLVLKER